MRLQVAGIACFSRPLRTACWVRSLERGLKPAIPRGYSLDVSAQRYPAQTIKAGMDDPADRRQHAGVSYRTSLDDYSRYLLTSLRRGAERLYCLVFTSCFCTRLDAPARNIGSCGSSRQPSRHPGPPVPAVLPALGRGRARPHCPEPSSDLPTWRQAAPRRSEGRLPDQVPHSRNPDPGADLLLFTTSKCRRAYAAYWFLIRSSAAPTIARTRPRRRRSLDRARGGFLAGMLFVKTWAPPPYAAVGISMWTRMNLALQANAAHPDDVEQNLARHPDPWPKPATAPDAGHERGRHGHARHAVGASPNPSARQAPAA